MTIFHWLTCAALTLLLFAVVVVFAAVFWTLAIVVGLPVVAVLSVVVLFRGRKTEVPPSKPDYLELILGRNGHIFVFRVRDRQSGDLLLPATMNWVMNDELPFTEKDAMAVMRDAVRASGELEKSA